MQEVDGAPLLLTPDALATASLAGLERERAAMWELPAAPLSLWDYSFTLTVPDTEDDYGQLQTFDPHSHPAQRHAIRAIDRREHTHFVFAADTQDGKSWLIQMVTFHACIERGQKVVIALPNRNLASDVWVGKLRPAIIGSGQERFLPESGGGSQGGSAPRVVSFKRLDGKGGGHMIWMSGQGRGEAGQASLTAPDIILDELDDWTPGAVERIERRADKFAASGRARFFQASTVKSDHADQSNILVAWEAGSKGRLAYECDGCGNHTRFLWETFDAEAVTIKCEHCGMEINDATRAAMLASPHSRDIHENPESRRYSLLWTALDSPWKSLAWLAESYRAADLQRQRGNHAPIRQFHRDQMVECYDGDVDARNLSKDLLALRSARSAYDRGIVPHEAERLCVAIDIQKDRCYWLALAGNTAGTYWVIDWGEEYFAVAEDGTPLKGRDPSDDERERMLDRIRVMANDGWPTVDGEPIPADNLIGVDIGYRSDAIGRWVRRTNVYAVRGDKPKKAAATRLSGGVQTGKLVKEYNGGLLARRKQQIRGTDHPAFWWFIRSNQSRDRTHSGLLLPEGQPGAILIPNGIGAADRLISHFTCWRLEADPDTGQSIWVKKGNRDDYDDCLIYGWNLLTMELDRTDRRRRAERIIAGATVPDDDDPESDTPAPEPGRRVIPPPTILDIDAGSGGFGDW